MQAESAITDVNVQYNRNLIDIFQAELEGWKTQVSAESDRVRTNSDVYRAALDRYRTRISARGR